MNNSEIREMVHSIINFTNDEVGRLLSNCTTQTWSQEHGTEMLTDAQARVLLAEISVAIKNSAFSVLQKS